MRRRMLGTLGVWIVGGGLVAAPQGPAADAPGTPGEAPVIMERPPATPYAAPARPAIRNVSPYQMTSPSYGRIEPVPTPPTQSPTSMATLPVAPSSPVAATSAVPAAGSCATGAGGCDPGYGVNPGEPFYGSFEYLFFSVRRGSAPPLIQILPQEFNDFAELPPGAARTIFGETGLDVGPFSGARARLGWWLNSSRTVGIEAEYFQLFKDSEGFTASSQGFPILGRGFFNTTAGRQSFLTYTQPNGSQVGFISVDAPTEIYGFETNVRWEGCSVMADRVDWLFGFRYFDLRESLDINSAVTFTTPPVTTISSFESFRTENKFYGTQAGFESHFRHKCWQLDIGGKLGSGWVNQDVRIAGLGTRAVAGQPTEVFPNQSILYVQPTNAGEYSRDKFAFLTEGIVRLGYQIRPNIRATVGYNIIALSSVMRPGGAVDEGINPSNTEFIVSRTPNTLSRPSFIFRGADFWAQGLTVGLSIAY